MKLTTILFVPERTPLANDGACGPVLASPSRIFASKRTGGGRWQTLYVYDNKTQAVLGFTWVAAHSGSGEMVQESGHADFASKIRTLRRSCLEKPAVGT